MQEKVSVRFWLIGIVVFLGVMAATASVEQGGVTYGIVDHQAAATAAMVDEIQTQWREEGVRNFAIFAVICDLGWIWIYALGSYLAGREFAAKRQGVLRVIGLVIAASGVVFGITDYVETISQFIQLLQDAGSDTLAGIAAFMQPIKSAAFVIAFIGVIIALVMDRFARRSITSS
ncbi:MAG: hypothetical protein ABJK59_09170 [Erythrobacter sp.]|uniref:hypothetical protein n=1 Tax=Erythrobacter sp. TaxID=1042 RepID=UPI003298CDC2